MISVKEVERYGSITNESTMDSVRRDTCICLQCANLKKCDPGKRFYELCVQYNCAFIMTRCSLYKEK